MRILRSVLLGLAVAASAAPALAAPRLTPEAQLAKALEGRVAGKPVNCISLSNIRSSEIIDHTAIVYHANNGRLYVNTPRNGLQSLDDDDILVTETWGSQLCRLDTVKLYDRGARFQSGFIGLEDFVPYTKVAKN